MSNETFSFTAGMHREWVAFLNGQQIASVYGIGKFEQALRSGDLRSGDETGKVRALYVITENDGTVRAACAFTIYRNEQGELQRELKLPIRELAEQGGEGPDLEAGAIRLARSGNCPTPWHASRLWGAEEADVDTYLLAIQNLLRDQIAAPNRARQAAPAQLATHRCAPVQQEERLLTAAQLDALRAKHREEVSELQREIVQLRRQLNNMKWTAA